jgi:hypothetical protein
MAQLITKMKSEMLVRAIICAGDIEPQVVEDITASVPRNPKSAAGSLYTLSQV